MKIFSYLFHLALALVMTGLATVAWLSSHPLNLYLLPWEGDTLTAVMFFGGLAGLIVTWLAVKRILPVLFVLWNVVVLVMLVRGFFFSPYTFGPVTTTISTALYFVLAALLAFAGSLFIMRNRSGEPAKRRTALA
ncbi:MAG TPA: hypothetical protein VN428_12285 [Bryobacteraceae bacterium]|nr:hypothetical protein [Bryobacteraceae bacterium]